MTSMLLSCLAAAAGLWLIWQVVRNYVIKNQLALVPGPPSSSIIMGNLYDLFSSNGWSLHEEVAKYGSISSITGMLGEKRLYIYDLAAIYSILIKEHESWDLSSWILDSTHTFLGPGLISVRGDVHRKQRKMLTPVFSIKHLRNMMPLFYGVAHNLVDAISSRVEGEAKPVDMLMWMSRAALEMIGQSGMGHSFDPLVDDAPDEYADAVANFVPLASTGFMSVVRQFFHIVNRLDSRSKWFLRKVLDTVGPENPRRLARVLDILDAKSREIYEVKKTAVHGKGGVGDAKDLMSILLKANMESHESDKLPEDQLVAQMSTILFAAMDTTSNALSRTLQLLAEHPEIQAKLRKELRDASNGEELEYDELHRLPYLDAICRETLRVHAPVTTLTREALKDTVIPLSEPIRATNGSMMHEIVVPRGSNVFLAVDACNRNKAIWGEDADEWKPERWLQPLPEAVGKAGIPGVYSHLMTFSGGNRACIGFKLSQLEMKLVLSVLVQKFAFERGDVPIFWNLSGVNYPSLSLESMTPEMWLTVRKL